jgi:lipoyl(octanoyl) transferase
MIELYDLGTAPYQPVWDLQAAIQQRLIKQKKERQNGNSGEFDNEVLLFVEHQHVYTLGKSGDSAHLLKGITELAGINVEFIQSDRGGDITYHGPGQIVGYPILDLGRHFTDIHKYMRSLEEVIIRTCRDFGAQAGRIDGLTGVWVGDAKICALGVRCSRWVTMHGFALNVNPDLSYFEHIIPCGIADKGVTSLQKLLNSQVDKEEVKSSIVTHFQQVFNVIIQPGEMLPELKDDLSYFKETYS